MNSNKLDIVVVVNSAETVVTANTNAPLQVLAQHALQQTGNQGRPLEDWELSLEDGTVLDLSRKLGEVSLPQNAVLFLNLLVGVNGAHQQVMDWHV